MDVGDGSNNGRRLSQKPKPKQQTRASVGTISFERSVENLSRAGRETVEMVNQCRKPLNSRPTSSSVVFDNKCPNYRWLRSGWLVEERRMLSSGKLTRYYYDPTGETYSTRHEVETMWDIEDHKRRQAGVLIILDD